MAFDLSQEYKVINLIGSTTVTADLNGTGVDLEQYEFDAFAIANVGLITSTTATYVINIQGSTALAGTYTTLASFNSLSGTAYSYDVAALDVDITDSTDNKYIRAQVDTTANGGTVSAVIGVNLLVKPVTATAGLNSATFA
jgi:hypothetical protein